MELGSELRGFHSSFCGLMMAVSVILKGMGQERGGSSQLPELKQLNGLVCRPSTNVTKAYRSQRATLLSMTG